MTYVNDAGFDRCKINLEVKNLHDILSAFSKFAFLFIFKSTAGFG